ncbi:MAG: DUF1800 domain-containing protein [Planctomycetota bacterium]
MSRNPSRWTRRALLAGGASGLAGLWLWRSGFLSSTLDGPIEWLLSRTSFGATAASLDRAKSLGYEETLEEQLHPESLDDDSLERRLSVFSTLGLSGPELKPLPGEAIVRELVAARLVRAIESRRQLFERIVDFWSDHFNVNHVKGQVPRFKTLDDRDVIRRHAFSRFEDLLRASAHSPAMLYYLDNHLNTASGPNENYARELLELHTVGIDAGYSQRDVEEMARVLTGWSVDESEQRFGTFRFDSAEHDASAKRVLGVELPAGGFEDEGERMITHLAAHPSASRFLATKLVRHFISEEAPEAVVRRVAERFSETQGDLRATYRELFSRSSIEAARPLVTRPVHFFALVARRTQARYQPHRALETFEIPLREMGQVPFQWKTPDGYPVEACDWISALLPRWKFAFDVADGRVPALEVEDRHLDEASSWLRGEERALLESTLPKVSGSSERDRRAMALCAPSWHWC